MRGLNIILGRSENIFETWRWMLLWKCILRARILLLAALHGVSQILVPFLQLRYRANINIIHFIFNDTPQPWYKGRGIVEAMKVLFMTSINTSKGREVNVSWDASVWRFVSSFALLSRLIERKNNGCLKCWVSGFRPGSVYLNYLLLGN